MWMKRFRVLFVLACIVSLSIFCSPLYAAPTKIIKGDRIRAIVKSYIERNMPWPKDAVRVEFPVPVTGLRLSGKKITYRIEKKRDEDFIGDSFFKVRFFDNGVFLEEKTVRIRLEVSMDIVVSAKSLPRNTRIGSDDVRRAKQWFDRVPSNIISSLDDVVGKELRTNIKPNTEITRNMVRSLPMVKRRKLVRIVLENDLLKITTIGLAQENGMLGDMVKVKNISSKRTIYARVVGDSLVRVEF